MTPDVLAGALLEQEICTLPQFSHSHLVTCFDADYKGNTARMLLELADNDLAAEIELMKKCGRYFLESDILMIGYQISGALAHLHALNVIHRDIKPGNVLVWHHTAGVDVKLCDFGVSILLSPEEPSSRTCIGTPFYQSPEMFDGEPYDFKVDIWALGCLLFELCRRAPAFETANMSPLALIARILDARHAVFPSRYTDDLKDLIVNKMLNRDPSRRPTAASIYRWFKRMIGERDGVKAKAKAKGNGGRARSTPANRPPRTRTPRHTSQTQSSDLHSFIQGQREAASRSRSQSVSHVAVDIFTGLPPAVLERMESEGDMS